MSKRRLDESWKGWLKENIERKCDPEELLGILLKNQFTVDSIRTAMGEKFPAHSELLGTLAEKESDIDYKAISQPRLTRPDSGLNVMRMVTDKLQLYVLDDFMTDEECKGITDISAKYLRPSTVTTGDRDPGYRTSSTCDLGLLDDPFVHVVDEKIARTLGIRLEYSEGNQAQRYEVGQEFKQHTDFFQPGTDDYSKYADHRGQRTWTFMVYLNTVSKGGGTKFFALDKIFMPLKGRAVIWNNLYPDGAVNRDTLHAGLPIEEGHKIIITKWFREKGSGPMFYDD